MKVLVIGAGGREHSLCWKLAQEAEVIALPGNSGIASVARLAAGDPVDVALAEGVDLAVVGPETPLIDGLADRLRSAGIATFGPGADGARLEGSKAFSKELMREAGVPTAPFSVFSSADDAHAYVSANGPVVVKADGAAFGKGVVVCSSEHEAHDAVDAMLTDNEFGPAGSRIVIEDRLAGPEFSLLTLCADGDFWSLPVAQDYKRALDGDRGPNTGGMGSFSPVAGVSDPVVREAEEAVVRPILRILQERGISYRGVLFSGLMVHEGRPFCLEFNVRFGDPEIQSLVLRLGKGFGAALLACARGEKIEPVNVLPWAAVTVVIASGGYPGSYETGKAITIGDIPEGVQVFHAGTTARDGQLITAGGRVFAISASGPTVEAARALAYQAAVQVTFDGAYFRRDIAG